MKSSVIAAALWLTHMASFAGTVPSNFLVAVRPVGSCISTALSQQTNALVTVTCQGGGQFISIEQRNGRPFVGTHGGAHRLSFSGNKSFPTGWPNSSELDHWIGQGTITSWRIFDFTERDERLEFLVSF